MCIRDSTFTAHPVKIGTSNGGNTEIISGINEGTVVVTEATIGSRPGSGAPDMSQEAVSYTHRQRTDD